MNNVYWEFKSLCILRKRFVSKKLFGNYLFRSGVNKLRIRLHSHSKKRCVREIFKELEKDYPSGRYQNIHTFIFDHCWIYFQQKKAIPIIGNSMAHKHFFVSRKFDVLIFRRENFHNSPTFYSALLQCPQLFHQQGPLQAFLIKYHLQL